MLDLAAELHGHEGRGVVVDDVGERSHDAVLDERLDDLCAGFLHAGSQLADADCVGNLHLDGCLLGYLKLQLLHAVALFCAALGAGRSLLLALLLLVGELLFAAALLIGVGAVRARHAVKALVVFAEVYIAAAARVDDPLLGHLARDVLLLLLGLRVLLGRLGLLLRLGLSLRLALSGLLGLLRLCSGLLLLGLGLGLRLFGGLRHTHQVLHRRALMLLRQALEDN